MVLPPLRSQHARPWAVCYSAKHRTHALQVLCYQLLKITASILQISSRLLDSVQWHGRELCYGESKPFTESKVLHLFF